MSEALFTIKAVKQSKSLSPKQESCPAPAGAEVIKYTSINSGKKPSDTTAHVLEKLPEPEPTLDDSSCPQPTEVLFQHFEAVSSTCELDSCTSGRRFIEESDEIVQMPSSLSSKHTKDTLTPPVVVLPLKPTIRQGLSINFCAIQNPPNDRPGSNLSGYKISYGQEHQHTAPDYSTGGMRAYDPNGSIRNDFNQGMPNFHPSSCDPGSAPGFSFHFDNIDQKNHSKAEDHLLPNERHLNLGQKMLKEEENWSTIKNSNPKMNYFYGSIYPPLVHSGSIFTSSQTDYGPLDAKGSNFYSHGGYSYKANEMDFVPLPLDERSQYRMHNAKVHETSSSKYKLSRY